MYHTESESMNGLFNHHILGIGAMKNHVTGLSTWEVVIHWVCSLGALTDGPITPSKSKPRDLK